MTEAVNRPAHLRHRLRFGQASSSNTGHARVPVLLEHVLSSVELDAELPVHPISTPVNVFDSNAYPRREGGGERRKG